MFKGFRWYDWVLGAFTSGGWIIFKLLINGRILHYILIFVKRVLHYISILMKNKDNKYSVKRILCAISAILIAMIGIGIYGLSDGWQQEELELALRENDLPRAESVLEYKPHIKTENGLTALQVVEKIGANLLEFALRENRLSTAERVLESSPNIKTENGLTALQVVEKIKVNLEEKKRQKEMAKKIKKLKSSAHFQSQWYVKKRLKCPSTAKFSWFYPEVVGYLGDGRFRVAGHVDSENSFGAKIRQNYLCVVKCIEEPSRKNKTGEWVLESLEFK